MANQHLRNGPLTRIELDFMHCPCGKFPCDDLYLKQRCHPQSGCKAIYNQKTGSLLLLCAVCEKFVGCLQIARNPLDK